MQTFLYLKDLLISTPYIDWSHPIQMNAPEVNDTSAKLQLKIFLRENHYKSRLMQLMMEWGYTCENVQ